MNSMQEAANMNTSIAKWCATLARSTPIFVVILFAVYGYYVYVIVICVSTVTNETEKIIYLIFFHLLFILCFWSFFRCIFTRMIGPPEAWRIPANVRDEIKARLVAKPEQKLTIEKEAYGSYMRDRGIAVSVPDVDGSIRCCNTCSLIKPDRCHHCSVCERCILRYDHHCPWINNCVGFSNYKYFVLFLFYTEIFTFYSIATAMRFFVQCLRGDDMPIATRIHIIAGTIFALIFFLSAMGLFGIHVCFTFQNLVSLDGMPGVKSKSKQLNRDFDLGWKRNFYALFGRNPLLWLIPVFTSEGDGCSYPTLTYDKTTI